MFAALAPFFASGLGRMLLGGALGALTSKISGGKMGMGAILGGLGGLATANGSFLPDYSSGGASAIGTTVGANSLPALKDAVASGTLSPTASQSAMNTIARAGNPAAYGGSNMLFTDTVVPDSFLGKIGLDNAFSAGSTSSSLGNYVSNGGGSLFPKIGNIGSEGLGLSNADLLNTAVNAYGSSQQSKIAKKQLAEMSSVNEFNKKQIEDEVAQRNLQSQALNSPFAQY